jgi:DNA-binding beta-propeller fold protein YncE
MSRPAIRAAAALGALGALPAVCAAVPLSVVNINPVPDTLVQFDTSDLSNQTVTHTFPTELVRGMDLTGPTTGWYVSVGGAAPGFYRLLDGVSTLVGAVPFTTSDVGGLTFNHEGTFLYYEIDEVGTSTEDVLYRVDFDGTFTRLGLITGLGAAPRTGGLAVHPVSGVVYGFNAANDTIYTLDPTTLAATYVGSGIGINTVNAVAGLDFTPDGRLFGTALLGSSSIVFEVDPATGVATTNFGPLGFVTSSLAFVPEPAAAGWLVVVAGLARRKRRA